MREKYCQKKNRSAKKITYTECLKDSIKLTFIIENIYNETKSMHSLICYGILRVPSQKRKL